MNWAVGATAKSILQVAGMLLLVVIFLITVMTAVAQQEALGRMAEEDLQLGYGSAFALVRAIDERQKELPALRHEEPKLARQHSDTQSALRRARDRFDSAWQAFLPIAQRLARSGRCELSAPAAAAEDVGSRLDRWNEARDCASGASLSPALAAGARQALAGPANVEAAVRELATVYDLATTSSEQLQSLRGRIEAASTLSEVEQKAQRSFAEMNVLRENWMLGSGFLVEFPPPMLQILLAFISGAFGALLVTLVLIVYPNTSFNITRGHETWARILLGGLIAMCVYIVLLGGTAVLGSSVGIAAAGTNYMAFCAIGILAGMFSDRVAYWLSDKADAFFKRADAAGG